jgi:NAD(P)-dependent dehydrogenase (short-subunit alcohol dehydrogenase family)
MKDFKDKVAVITGAGSGIGLALAIQCAQEGMKVVLADIDEKFLRRAQRRVKRIGVPNLAVLTDVSKANDLETLAKKTIDTFGAVHLLFNNAAVSNTKYTWNYTLNDWKWQLGVNLFGVIHGICTFVPIMIKQDNECHVVNISSIEGLLSGSGPGGAIYGVSKHGIMSLSETLRRELEMKYPKIKVSVVCPGAVITNIWFGDVHRQEEYQDDPNEIVEDSKVEEYYEKYPDGLKESPPISSEKAVDLIFQEIKEDKFYILTHKDPLLKGAVKERFDNILNAFDN